MKVGFGLILIVSTVVIFLGVQPWLWGSVFDAAAAFRDRQTQHIQLASVNRLTDEIRMIDGTAQSLLDQATAAFPPVEAAPQVVERLEALGQAQGLAVQLTSITESPPGSKAALIPFEVNLVAVGPAHSLLAFLEAVEHMQELAAVETWEIQAAAPVYSVAMHVTFFLQPK